MTSIKIRKHQYCTKCYKNHRVGDVVEICAVCSQHAIGNQLYDLKIHNLSVDHAVNACRTCTESLYKMARKGKGDPWIQSMMTGLYDEY